MKTKKITITIELPMDSKQASKWVNKNDFIRSTLNEIYTDIKNNLITHSGNIETDDEIGCYILKVSETKHGDLEKQKPANNLDNAKKYLIETNFEFFTQSEQNVIGKTMVAYAKYIKAE